MGRKSARYIAKACACKTEKVYRKLKEMGYVKRYGLNKWLITEKGFEHGEYSNSIFDTPIWDQETQERLFRTLATGDKIIGSKPEMIYEDYFNDNRKETK